MKRTAASATSSTASRGTPIEKTDANTLAVFGDYISVYDIQRAVFDDAKVPIYYGSRLAKLEQKESERPKIDPEFEAATEGEEVERIKWYRESLMAMSACPASNCVRRFLIATGSDRPANTCEARHSHCVILSGPPVPVFASHFLCELYGVSPPPVREPLSVQTKAGNKMSSEGYATERNIALRRNHLDY